MLEEVQRQGRGEAPANINMAWETGGGESFVSIVLARGRSDHVVQLQHVDLV